MSVLIKGIKAPESCDQCQFKYPTMEGGECMFGVIQMDYQKRPDDCPAGPVPPHGRLIDADAFSSEMKERQTAAIKWMRESVQDHDAFIRAEATVAFLSEVKLTLDKTPTIIQAEEAKE